MEKVRGKEALIVKAEVEAGKRTLDDRELQYLNRQVESFTAWLMNTNNMSPLEAQEITQAIIDREIKLLLEEDPFADFIWSRGQEVGDVEISISDSIGANFEQVSNLAHLSEQDYWARMEHTADSNVGKYPDEVWAASKEKMESILVALDQYTKEKTTTLSLKPEATQRLRKWNKRINDLRFGKKPVLLSKHWKQCKNVINALLDNPKRYEIKESQQKTEEEKIDALDNAVYGYFDGNELYS